MRTPVIVITGVAPDPMAAAAMALQWELPGAVVVHHQIDVEAQQLIRLVSDVTGVVERHVVDLAHACVSCAIREDVVPTITRCASDDRWQTVLAHLPVAAEAEQVCAMIGWDRDFARHARITTVITALEGPSLIDDLLGDDLLAERDLHTSDDDRRGVGEVACGMVEYADITVLTDSSSEAGFDLVRTLARPDALVISGPEHLQGEQSLMARHHLRHTGDWIAPVLPELPSPASPRVWQRVLESPRPFHPERLLESLELLGAGRHRSRGCFWLPTRPGIVQAWDGAGGQVSIGSAEQWGQRTPLTKLVITGVGTAPAGLEATFEHLLVSPEEALLDQQSRWRVPYDGFEPWLGEIKEVA